MEKEFYTYGCDLCGRECDWDNDIYWLTSSFGVCEDCYDKIPENIREKIVDDVWDNEVEEWVTKNCRKNKID